MTGRLIAAVPLRKPAVLAPVLRRPLTRAVAAPVARARVTWRGFWFGALTAAMLMAAVVSEFTADDWPTVAVVGAPVLAFLTPTKRERARSPQRRDARMLVDRRPRLLKTSLVPFEGRPMRIVSAPEMTGSGLPPLPPLPILREPRIGVRYRPGNPFYVLD
jgi:hypothetical protein